MGFFSAELAAILIDHQPQGAESPWLPLQRLGVHPQQVERLQHAADDIGQVATLQANVLQQLRQELGLMPIEWARLQAGSEADTFFRLLVYHNYPLEEAANKSNAVFAAVLKDKLATGGRSESIYPTTPAMEQIRANAPQPRRRGRRKNSEVAAEQQRAAELLRMGS
jgi:hypothetical protein